MSDSRAFIGAGKVFIVQPQLIHHFLFKELATKQNLAKYTAPNQTIHSCFGHRLDDAARYELSVNRAMAWGQLAEIVVLSQLSHNVYRKELFTVRTCQLLPRRRNDSVKLVARILANVCRFAQRQTYND